MHTLIVLIKNKVVNEDDIWVENEHGERLNNYKIKRTSKLYPNGKYWICSVAGEMPNYTIRYCINKDLNVLSADLVPYEIKESDFDKFVYSNPEWGGIINAIGHNKMTFWENDKYSIKRWEIEVKNG